MPRNDPNLIKQEATGLAHYVRVAAMLIDDYPDLLPQEKWLYVALVYLCGKEGNRYLSLRYISERTGISRSALAADKRRGDPGAIQRLHEVGLIHAEIRRKKDRAGNAIDQAQYHITITDIWQLNAAFYADQERPQGGQDDESVRKTDTKRPQNGRERPQNGRERPQNGRERPQNGRERPQNGRERPQNGRVGAVEPPVEPVQEGQKSLLQSNITSNNYKVIGGISGGGDQTESLSNDSSPSFSKSTSFSDHSDPDSDTEEDDTPTEESPAIRRPPAADAAAQTPALRSDASVAPPRLTSRSLLSREQVIYALVAKEYGATLLPTPDNKAGAKLLVEGEVSDADISKTVRGILNNKKDPFWANNFSLLAVAKQLPVYCRAQPVGAGANGNGTRASPGGSSAEPPRFPARGDTWRGPDGLQVFWNNQWIFESEAYAAGYNGGFEAYK